MKVRAGKFLFLLLMIVLSSCGPWGEVVPIQEAGEWVDAIDQFPDRGASDCLTQEEWAARHQTGFDVLQYFEVFEHLSMESGYTLDYVYLQDGAGCKPVIYAHADSAAPFASYGDYVLHRDASYQASYERIEGSEDFLDHVRIDDTPEGYAQFVMLAIVADQFHLYWHALYNDTRIVTTVEQAERVFAPLVREAEGAMYGDAAERAHRVEEEIPNLDYMPTVEMREDRAIVRVMVFSEWGGFSEMRVSISRSFPHEIHRWTESKRLSYNSGKVF